MKNKLLILTTIILLSGCATAPSNKLINGVTRPANLSDVEINEHIGFSVTFTECNRLMWRHNKSALFLNCLLNLCIPVACSYVQWDVSGEVESCDVYLLFDLDLMRSHELRHCVGYDDSYKDNIGD